jgi:hypothetical protein
LNHILDPRLGGTLSEHRPALTYPILFGLITLCLAAGGVYVGTQSETSGYFVALGSLVFYSLYLAATLRRHLTISEHGFCLRSGSKQQVILWRDITKVSATYSYHPHPDTIIDIVIKADPAPRVVLKMTWSNHKAIRAAFWPLLEPRSAAPGA